MSNTQQTPIVPSASSVPEAQRGLFLPRLFGSRHFLVGEMAVYNFMTQFSPIDYAGAYWEFYQLDAEPLYLAPTSKPRYRMAWDMNGWKGEVSADAAGIIVSLFALSHLSFQFESEVMSDGFHRLREFAYGHPEARDIFSAID